MSLQFDGMDDRRQNIKTAQFDTCKWLLRSPEYCDWMNEEKLRQHGGFLWIKGKPGSGKSTIMKKSFEWAKATWKDQIVLAYFFDGRAPGELERSCLGLYRSIIYQILTVEKTVRAPFLEEFSSFSTDEFNTHWPRVFPF